MVARVTRLVAEKFVLSTFPRALTTLSSMCSRAVRALESSPGLIMMMDKVASAVTGLYPWLGYKLSDRVSVWGVTGYGKGALTLTPGEGAALTSGLSMAMAAAGTRGALVAGGASGFELAFKADALWVGTSIDGVEGPGGNLAATVAAVTRFRTASCAKTRPS